MDFAAQGARRRRMVGRETSIEMARRHVREGERHVTEQRARLAWMRRRGHPTETAEDLLANFETIQTEHEAHLARLEAEARGP